MRPPSVSTITRPPPESLVTIVTSLCKTPVESQERTADPVRARVGADAFVRPAREASVTVFAGCPSLRDFRGWAFVRQDQDFFGKSAGNVIR